MPSTGIRACGVRCGSPRPPGEHWRPTARSSWSAVRIRCSSARSRRASSRTGSRPGPSAPCAAARASSGSSGGRSPRRTWPAPGWTGWPGGRYGPTRPSSCPATRSSAAGTGCPRPRLTRGHRSGGRGTPPPVERSALSGKARNSDARRAGEPVPQAAARAGVGRRGHRARARRPGGAGSVPDVQGPRRRLGHRAGTAQPAAGADRPAAADRPGVRPPDPGPAGRLPARAERQTEATDLERSGSRPGSRIDRAEPAIRSPTSPRTTSRSSRWAAGSPAA